MKYKCYGRITTIVSLMSFLTMFPVYGEQQTTLLTSLDGSGTRRYSELEVDTLIEDLTGAAYEAIEQAAAEAAKAVALASLEREAVAIHEVQRLQGENSNLKKGTIKTAAITGVICFLGGLAVGTGGIAIIQGVK